jgi:hypothetical protein
VWKNWIIEGFYIILNQNRGNKNAIKLNIVSSHIKVYKLKSMRSWIDLTLMYSNLSSGLELKVYKNRTHRAMWCWT